MKSKLLPVVLTAAVTSFTTFLIANHFNRSVPYFAEKPSNSSNSRLVSYSGDVANGTAALPNLENAAEVSVKAVVHIKTVTKAKMVTDNNMNDVWSQMFGQHQYLIQPTIESGSGVVISADGYIVTNNHVVANGDEVTVTYNDRMSAKAKVVAKDPNTDLAVLKVDDVKDLPYLDMGNSDDVKVGQWVLAIGYPLSLDATVTAGIVSAKSRSIGINKQHSANAIESFIQTDAAVNPGNSGGALVNSAGQLIGINSAIASPTGSYAGYSYAIPVNIVRKVVNDLMKFGTVQRAYLGVSFVDYKSATTDQIKKFGLDKNEGIYVMDVLSDGAAAKAGIAKGDIITHINKIAVKDQPGVEEQMARYRPGDEISITYLRNEKSTTASVKLDNKKISYSLMGASFRALTDKEKSDYGLEYGLVITDPGTGLLARRTNVRKGFILLTVNDKPVHTINELNDMFGAHGNVQISGIFPGLQGRYYFNFDTDGGDRSGN